MSKLSSVLPDEVEKFSKIAQEWWDPLGKFAPLHKFNPPRIAYIKEKSLEKFSSLKNLTLLDVGCGGGLLSEPLSQIGFQVTGLDASLQNIQVAKAHAAQMGYEINYMQQLIEDFQIADKFDVVLCMEVIEHVNNPQEFLQNVADKLKPGGLLFVATLNRTIKSLLLAKFAAEYILNWLPHGTHDWQKFLKPSEISSFLEDDKFVLKDISGLTYNICQKSWRKTPDISQNYMMVFEKSKN